MSADVKAQIHGYASQLEDSQASIDASEVLALVETVRVLPSHERQVGSSESSAPLRQDRPWLVAAAAATAVLVLVGGAAWLFRVTGSDRPVATTPVIESSSSITWSRVPHDESVFGGEGSEWMFDVTVGGQGLVAVGSDGSDAMVWTSVDGITWSRVPHDETVFGGAGMSSVTVGGPGLVAVGSANPHNNEYAVAWTSVDGITWSRVPHDEAVFGGVGDQWIGSVTVGGPGLVAVGWDRMGFDADAAVWTSVDGFTWSRVPHDEAVFGGRSYQGMWEVTAGGPGLVAVGEDRSRDFGDGDVAVWTSVDGISWSRVPHDEENLGEGRVTSVTTTGSGLVAVGNVGSDAGDDAAVWTSVDGITWLRVPHDEDVFGGAAGGGMQSVTAIGQGLLSVGVSGEGAAAWTSPDGITWSRVQADSAVFGGAGMESVTLRGPGVVAVGGGNDNAVVWVAVPEE